jgi:hypothetical protein
MSPQPNDLLTPSERDIARELRIEPGKQYSVRLAAKLAKIKINALNAWLCERNLRFGASAERKGGAGFCFGFDVIQCVEEVRRKRQAARNAELEAARAAHKEFLIDATPIWTPPPPPPPPPPTPVLSPPVKQAAPPIQIRLEQNEATERARKGAFR